jgi:hypothetical protein
MEAIFCSETSVDFYRAAVYYIPEDTNLHTHRCAKLMSSIATEIWKQQANRTCVEKGWTLARLKMLIDGSCVGGGGGSRAQFSLKMWSFFLKGLHP